MLVHSDRKWAVLCRAVLHLSTVWRRREWSTNQEKPCADWIPSSQSKVRQNTISTMTFLDFSKAFQARDFLLISNFFSGLGPGGFIRGQYSLPWRLRCIPGSSHGGIAQAQNGKIPYSGPAYDQNDTVSLLGGSGGEINYLITCMNQSQQAALWLWSKY